MASGVEICDDVKDMIAKMKVVKSGDDQNDRVRLAIFSIRDCKEIIVAKMFNQKDVGDSPVFSIITDEMKEDPCFYALYDCNFQTKDNVDKDDLIFITWTSDAASIKNKMIYASSKENLKGCMKGVKHHMQLNDHSDWSRQALAEKIQDKSTWRVAKIEKVDI
uniref:Cofilin 1 (non-muscle), like n=1 Tax=Amphiprion percula TaxID=161767 RepID=A0A3P8UAC5_AMPPE